LNELITAIIPARGGSKGVPKKNIRHLDGKPLIHHTIDAAKMSRYIDHIIVSTDDDEIASVAATGGITIIKRPEELAGDKSPTIDAILHALEECARKEVHPDVVVLLQPTSPLRSVADIDEAIGLYLEGDCESVISVTESAHPPYWNMIIDGGYLQPLYDQEVLKKRRQDLPQTYLPNGAIYIASHEVLKQYRSFYTPKTKPYYMSPENSLDIDTEIDFLVADSIIKHKS
jgi:N-acylneuraminate cytidylyltransferase